MVVVVVEEEVVVVVEEEEEETGGGGGGFLVDDDGGVGPDGSVCVPVSSEQFRLRLQLEAAEDRASGHRWQARLKTLMESKI
eukprot:108308-Rhodomonas_salina.1